MNITDPVVIPSLANETFNQSENSSVISATILSTTEPQVTETIQPMETLLPVDTTTTPVLNETLTDTPATIEPTPEPTVTDSIRPEDTHPQTANATTTPVPVETLASTPVTTEPTPEPTITPGNSRKETQISPVNSPQKSLRALARSPGKAPVNPAFISYQNRTKQSQIKLTSVKESTTIVFNDGSTSRVFLEGEIPSPVDFSYTSGQSISLDAGSFSDGSVLPGSYDLRNYGRVSTVKDQGSAGVCWAFATIASLESFLLPDESLDFSENHMKNTLASTYPDGFDRTWDEGGNRWISTAYLTRWSGPVLESADPYSDVSGTSPSGLNPNKHVQDVYFLPVRSNPSDNDNIKNALMNLGAVQGSIHWDNSYYNITNHAFYNPSDDITNHAITIVGWDDTYSRMNFTTVPAMDGAFIVKNSWGSGWADNGYFYVSYSDLTIGDSCIIFTGEPVTNYDRVYGYDPLGWVASYGYGTTTAQYANVFTSQSAEILTAIGIYETFPGSFTARIYLDPVGGPINASGYVATTSWSDSLLGYHTIDIPDVVLKPGQKYSVVISASTPGDYYPIPVEYPAVYYSSHATANSGESYVSPTGTTWTDMTTVLSNTNVCVKGYTKVQTVVNAEVVSTSIPATMVAGQSYPVSVTMKNTGTKMWSSTDPIRFGAVGGTSGDSYKFGLPDHYHNRVNLPTDISVAPGESYTFSWTVTAPATPGTYTPTYRMVWEFQKWFGDTVSQSVLVTSQTVDADVMSTSIPASMIAGKSYPVSVTMKNTGTKTWTSTDPIRFGAVGGTSGDAYKFGLPDYYHNRVNLPTDISVAPGESYTFGWTVTAPATPGTYTPTYRMVWEFQKWFGDTVSQSVVVSVVDADTVSTSIPASMIAGQSYPVSVTMKNTGTKTWTSTDPIRLGAVGSTSGDAYKFGLPDHYHNRVNLPTDISVAPGESYTFSWTVTAPATPGTYTPTYRMVWEFQKWFGDPVSSAIQVSS